MGQITFEEIIGQYNKLLDESRRLDFLVRDKELQEGQVKKLDEFRECLTGYKRQAVQLSDEKLANTFFHLRCVINAQMSSLRTWICIKDGKMQWAWNYLVDAQEYLVYAFQTSDGRDELDGFAERLRAAERLMFPGVALYNSLGLIFVGGVCSICEGPLEACEHLEGKVYWGRVCTTVKKENLSIDHLSLVTSPKDRKCIITEYSADDGLVHDYLTWKVLRPAKEGEERHMTGVVLTTGDLDLY